MGKKVESYQSDDGKLFPTEREMILHEIKVALESRFPELRVQIPTILNSADILCLILKPLVEYNAKNHPDPAPETTRKPTPLRAVDDGMVSMKSHG